MNYEKYIALLKVKKICIVLLVLLLKTHNYEIPNPGSKKKKHNF